jgi:hypothetical protein
VPVDRDAARGDEVLARSPTTDTGRSQELLQAHAIGIMDINLDGWLIPRRG